MVWINNVCYNSCFFFFLVWICLKSIKLRKCLLNFLLGISFVILDLFDILLFRNRFFYRNLMNYV